MLLPKPPKTLHHKKQKNKRRKHTMSEERTINDSIRDIVTDEINQIPAPTPCEIIATHTDGTVTIQTKNYGKLTHTPTITPHTVGDKTVLLFLNQNLNERIVI